MVGLGLPVVFIDLFWESIRGPQVGRAVQTVGEVLRLGAITLRSDAGGSVLTAYIWKVADSGIALCIPLSFTSIVLRVHRGAKS